MSAGSPRITFRVPQALLDKISLEMSSQNEHSVNSPEDMSRFITHAIEDHIAHRQRSRAKRSPRVPRDADGWPLLRYSLCRTDV